MFVQNRSVALSAIVPFFRQGGRHCHVQRWASTHFCENTEFGLRPRQFCQEMAEIKKIRESRDADPGVQNLDGWLHVIVLSCYIVISCYIYISLRFYAVKRSQDLILWVKVPRFCLLKSPSWRFFPWSCPRWTKLVTPCCMASTPSWQKTELEPREPENVPRLGWKQQIYGYGSIPVKIGFQ